MMNYDVLITYGDDSNNNNANDNNSNLKFET